MNFPPIIILLILWVLMGLASSKKKAQQKAARNEKPGAEKAGAKAPKAEPERSAPAAQPQVEPARPIVLQPTITFTEHDDSVYRGSMNADTGEGYDPCHDEQLSVLSEIERETVPAPAETPGLQLDWSGSEVVRGFVMSEILTRKRKVS